MPEIFRACGYSFVFFSHDHEPMHVHVIGNNGDAKYVWNGEEFAFREQHNIKSGDLKRIKAAIDKKSTLIIEHWNKYFGKEDNDENRKDLV